MRIERTTADDVVEEQLPDGSRVLTDHGRERVVALNATAGAAWEACRTPTTLERVTEEMQRSLGPSATAEVAEEAILRLRENDLVRTMGVPARPPSRRQFIAQAGAAAALPLVIAMTMSEQRAYAQHSNSGHPTGPTVPDSPLGPPPDPPDPPDPPSPPNPPGPVNPPGPTGASGPSNPPGPVKP